MLSGSVAIRSAWMIQYTTISSLTPWISTRGWDEIDVLRITDSDGSHSGRLGDCRKAIFVAGRLAPLQEIHVDDVFAHLIRLRRVRGHSLLEKTKSQVFGRTLYLRNADRVDQVVESCLDRRAAGSRLTYTLVQETPRRSTLPMHQLEQRCSDGISPWCPSIVRATCRAGLARLHSPTTGEWGESGVFLGSAPLECGSVEVGLSVGVGSCVYYLNCRTTDPGRVSYSIS
jgi:hypothetical protein